MAVAHARLDGDRPFNEMGVCDFLPNGGTYCRPNITLQFCPGKASSAGYLAASLLARHPRQENLCLETLLPTA